MESPGIETQLTKKIGGIPAWGIAVGLAAAAILFFYIRSKNDAVRSDATQEPEAPADMGSEVTGDAASYPTSPIQDYLSADPTNPAYPVGDGTQNNLPGPITNEQWARLAFADLVGKGNDPIGVGNALRKFLNGQALNPQEQAWIALAEKDEGPPPEGVMPVIIAPGSGTTPLPNPTPTPTPTPTTGYVQVKVVAWKLVSPPWNSTMWGIARHYGYGSASNNYVPIWNDPKNAALVKLRKSPGLIRSGDIVWVKPK